MRAESTGAAVLIEREPREHIGEEKPQRRRLGAGRSGEVWLVETPHGRSAVKVFFGDTLSNLVHYIVSGAPNPYIWNEDAIRAAYERRHILKVLASAWFGGVLRVSNALGLHWNADAGAWELATEFVDGALVPLLHPLRPGNPQLDELREEVMAPLQQHLEEAGFDGAVWQAGWGNPVALNNFLWLNPAGSRDARFAFIDLESGVPALFPMNPLELLRYYLPRSWRHGHALFDDVDVPRLSRYVEERRREFGAALGPAALDELEARIDRLGHHQSRWRALDRAQAGIAYQLAKGRLSGPQRSTSCGTASGGTRGRHGARRASWRPSSGRCWSGCGGTSARSAPARPPATSGTSSHRPTTARRSRGTTSKGASRPGTIARS